MYNRGFSLLAVLCIWLLVCTGSLAEDTASKTSSKKARVAFKSSPVLVKGTVTLRDIALIDCQDKSLLAQLESVVLGPAPIVGSRRRIDKDYITLRMRQQKINPSWVEISGSAVIELESEPVGTDKLASKPAGTVIDSGVKGSKSLINKNQPVTILVSAGSIHIEAVGKALEAGSLGSVIRVQINQTGKILQTRVLDEQRVVLL